MSDGIAYQNKDIEFKLLSDVYKEKSFEAYGLKIPRIKEVLPTNLPTVSANEKHMDNLFLLADDTYAIVDYESEEKKDNCIKYVNYIGRVMERYYRENKVIPKIRVIVIYTGDVEYAKDVYDMGCMTVKLDQVFISHLPAEEIYQGIKHKLDCGEALREQEPMQLIVLPLAGKGGENKQKLIEQIIELVELIKDEQEQLLVVTGLLVASDKFIRKEYAERIRRRFGMTKIGRLIHEDGAKECEAEIILKMYKNGFTAEQISNAIEKDVQEIKKIIESREPTLA